MKPGEAMAGADFFDFHVRGSGSHGAMPQQGEGPDRHRHLAGPQLQTIVSRNVAPTDPLVLLGHPDPLRARPITSSRPEVTVSGTMRFFDTTTAEHGARPMQDLAAGMAQAYGIEIDLDIREIFDVLVNDEQAQPRHARHRRRRGRRGEHLRRRPRSAPAPRISPTCCASCPAPIARWGMPARCRCTTRASSWTSDPARRRLDLRQADRAAHGGMRDRRSVRVRLRASNRHSPNLCFRALSRLSPVCRKC